MGLFQNALGMLCFVNWPVCFLCLKSIIRLAYSASPRILLIFHGIPIKEEIGKYWRQTIRLRHLLNGARPETGNWSDELPRNEHHASLESVPRMC